MIHDDDKNSEPKTGSSSSQVNGKDVVTYLKNRSTLLITSVFVLVGLLIFLLQSFFIGSLIIGGLLGFFHSPKIVAYVRKISTKYTLGINAPRLVAVASGAALVFAIPGFFLGAIGVALFRYVLLHHND